MWAGADVTSVVALSVMDSGRGLGIGGSVAVCTLMRLFPSADTSGPWSGGTVGDHGKGDSSMSRLGEKKWPSFVARASSERVWTREPLPPVDGTERCGDWPAAAESAQDTRRSPRIGPAILDRESTMCWQKHRAKRVPCVAIELAAFVHSEDEEHLAARPERLVKDAFIVPLGGPKPFLYTQIEVVLDCWEISHEHIRAYTTLHLPESGT